MTDDQINRAIMIAGQLHEHAAVAFHHPVQRDFWTEQMRKDLTRLAEAMGFALVPQQAARELAARDEEGAGQ